MVRRREQAAEVMDGADTQASATGDQTSTADATAPVTQTAPSEEKRAYNPVRSWGSRFLEPLRYQKLTDNRMKKIIFRFNLPEGQDKPPTEALEMLRSHKQTPEGQPTGLKFEQTRTHGKVWTIPNDPEGRELADRIDYELSKLAKKMEAAQPTPG